MTKMNHKWKLMYEGPRLSHLLAKHIFLFPYSSKKLEKLTGFQDKNYLWYSNTKENLHGGYYLDSDMKKAKENGYKYFTDKKKFKKWIKEQNKFHKLTKDLMNKYKFEKNIEKLSKKRIIELIPKIAKIRSELFVYILSCQPQNTEGLADRLKDLIKIKIKDEKLAKQIYINLTAPEKKIFSTQEKIDWLNIVIKVKQKFKKLNKEELGKTSIYKEIVKHYNKYFLIPASDRTEPWDLNHFEELMLNNLNSEIDFKKKKEELENKYKYAIIKKEQLIKKYKLSDEAKELGKLIAEIGYYRFISSFYGRWLGYYLGLICKKYSDEVDLSFEELSSCTEKELIYLLSGKKIVSKEQLMERAEAETILIKDGKINVYFGKQAIEVRNTELGRINYENLDEVKGEIASLGKVQGRAFVFYWNDNINKKVLEMPKDAILIAPQTHPAYLPAMYKAKAFATDEGGITGHAAIVARELNKPCVIGLHYITKVVKTGDLIEVDANNGLVRILERKKNWQLMSEGPSLSHFFMSIIWSEVFKGKYHDKYTNGYQTPNFIWYNNHKKGFHAEYRTKEWMDFVEKKAFENFMNDNYFYNYIKEIDKWILKSKKIEKTLGFGKKYKKEELLRFIEDLLEVYKQLIGSIFSNWPEYTEGLSKKLKTNLEKNIENKKQRDEIFIILTYPESMLPITIEEIEFLDLAIQTKILLGSKRKILKNKEVTSLLKEHYKKYKFISASDRTKPWSKKELFLRLVDILNSSESLKNKRLKLISKYGTILDKKRELISKYNLDSETFKLASRVSIIGHYRFKASFAWRILGYFLVEQFKMFAEEENLDYQVMTSLKVEELIRYLKGEKLENVVPIEELKKRAEAELFYIKDHKQYFFFGVEATKKKDSILGKQDHTKNVISGKVGSNGYAKGKAFVFGWNDNLEKNLSNIPKDAILVVPQTHPAYMPIIRKASALVTDEGGITGHAAIVSRELGKPSVIGTHIATKSIKTGDIIEVDANKGIVKVLKRCNPSVTN